MIVEMVKLWLLVKQSDRDAALDMLRREGVLHIEALDTRVSDSVVELEVELKNIETVLLGLSDGKHIKDFSDRKAMNEFVAKIISDCACKKTILKQIADIKRELEWFDAWGDVDPELVEQLNNAGLFVELRYCDIDQFGALAKCYDLIRVKRQKKKIWFLVVSFGDNARIDCPIVKFPKVGKAALYEQLAALESRIDEIDKFSEQANFYSYNLTEWRDVVVRELEFTRVKSGMRDAGEITVVKGFCPDYDASKIKVIALREGWGYAEAKPLDTDNVPTLVKNPRWISIINPVFNCMQTFPGYKEFDISLWFLVFFSIFFAMLIGDAGYGIVFVLLTLIAQWRVKPKNEAIAGFVLMYLLAGTTIVWGAITGTWFGARAIAELPGFRLLVVDGVNSFLDSSRDNMMYICFLLGTIHLTVAHIIKMTRKIGSLKILGDVGWVGVLWSLFFVVGKLVLGRAVPNLSMWLGVGGVTLILLFSNYQKNIFKGILLAFANLPLSLVNSFSDIISYIRLFAVGAASVAMASTFNSMALSGGIDSVFAGLIAALVLFLGHTLNIVLGLMAILVHGVRLNMLEFSGHLGMEWLGHKYKPFT